MIPSYEQSIIMLYKAGCVPDVIFHCIQISMKATELAERIKAKGHEVDVELVKIGGLLHDIGRSKTDNVWHVLHSAEILKRLGIDERIIKIAERHVGGGITDSDAKAMGFPDGIYLPETLEEKIVCYADKLFHYKYNEKNNIEKWIECEDVHLEIEKLKNKFGQDNLTWKRLEEIEKEIRGLL